jgi:hypothetical protein
LKHTEIDEDGKEFISPLAIEFKQIEPFSLYDEQKPDASDESEEDETAVMPQVFQNGELVK